MDSNTQKFRPIELEFRQRKDCRMFKIQGKGYIEITFQVGNKYWTARSGLGDTGFIIDEFDKKDRKVVKNKNQLKGNRIRGYNKFSDFEQRILGLLELKELIPRKVKKKANLVGDSNGSL